MNSDRWSTLRALFDELADLPPAERDARLNAADIDDGMRAELVALLAADDTPADLLNATQPGLRLAATPPLPEALGPYRIDALIARGGMGAVYRAHRDTGDYEQTVAIKVLRRGLDTDDVLQRFHYERQILASLQHPNIAHLIDGGSTDDGLPYFVMEYVEGQPITAYADAQRLTIAQRLELFQTVCDAVQYAHQNLVIHRDLKPSNILVTAEGQVKLLDFGIAKLVAEEPAADAVRTQTGMRVMTPEYAAPEQIKGEAITTATDVYQLGILLYELLIGTRPFRLQERARHALEQAILQEQPTRPSTAVHTTTEVADVETATVAAARSTSLDRLQRNIRGDLDTIVLMALRKEADRRYGSAAQLAEDLRRYQSGLPVEARPASVGYRVERFVRRNRAGVAAAAVMLVLLTGAGIFSAVQAQRAVTERDRARSEALASETVTNLLVDLFQQADTGRTEGETVTVRQVLDDAPARLEEELPDQPTIRGRLLSRIGRVYANLSLYEEADSILQVADGLLALDPEARIPRAQALTHRGWTMRQVGALADADSMYQAALALLEPLAASPDEALTVLLGMAQVALDQFEVARADSLLTVSAALAERAGTPAGQNNLADLHQFLAEKYMAQNQFADAEAAFDQAMYYGEAAHGRVSTPQMMIANNFASFLSRTGRYQKADTIFRELAYINTQLYGDLPRMNRAGIYHAWATNQRRSGNLIAADTLWNTALGDLRVIKPVVPPALGAVLNSVAGLKRELGDLDAAEALFKEATPYIRQTRGDKHPDTFAVENNLALTYLAQENYELAIDQLESIVARARNAFSPPDQYLADFTINLAGAYVKVGRLADAEPLARDAATQFDALFTEPHRKRMNTRHTLAEILRRSERLEEARLVMQDTQAMSARVPTGLEHTNGLLVRTRLYRDLAEMDSARYALDRLTTVLDSLGVASGEQYESAQTLRAELAAP
ncbi:MAG: serine/threonine-protein kinase [Bacteroidota bacterium]